MGVFKRGQRGNVWAYDFWRNGQRYQGYCVNADTGLPAKNESEAKRIERQLIVAAESGVAPTPKKTPTVGGYSFAEALEAVMQDRLQGDAAHLANLAIYSRDLLGFFGDATPIIEITRRRVDEYRSYLAKQCKRVWIGGRNKSLDRSDPRYWKTTDQPRSAITNNYYLDLLRAVFAKAHKTRDPATGASALPFPPEVKPFEELKRLPTPMPDAELMQRRKVAMPWVRDAADLARLFGLRRAEALKLTVDHIDDEREALRWSATEVKSGADEYAFGGDEGFALLLRLAEQAKSRGVRHLVTWPGLVGMSALRNGKPIAEDTEWKPLTTIKTAWNGTARRASLTKKHRFHDVRARYVTEIAKDASGAATQKAARHADPKTTQRYIGIASSEIADIVKATNRKARGLRAQDGDNVVDLAAFKAKGRAKKAATKQNRKAA